MAAGRKPRKAPLFPLPYLKADDKADVRRRHCPATAADYLHHLRIKFNYEDSTMFTEGPDDEVSSTHVHDDLVRLASSVLLMHELHVHQLVGRAMMTRTVDDWIAKSMPTLNLRIGLRRDLILA